MKINLSESINRTYVQSLCMAFFHGISFPKDENEDADGLALSVSTEEREDGIFCQAELSYRGKIATKELLYSPASDESEARALKTVVGQAVYSVCKDITEKDIEWGILTGIRPSKVCAELLLTHSVEETAKILRERYLLSANKTELVIEVAKNEATIMSMTDNSKCSIYISIPFCPSRCTYCSFISYAGKKLFDLIPSYVDRIIDDIRETTRLIKEIGLEILCVYIGGGTPTILTENQLESVLGTINECIDVSKLDEFTLEGGRPDTITDKKLEIAKKYGVNRISVNPQSLNDTVLERIGRRHTVNDFLVAYEKVKNSKIDAINTDLIAGLDGDDLDSFKATVDKIIDLEPENVTVHSFCVKKSAQILRDNEEIYDKEGEDARLSVFYAYDRLIKCGYVPYYMYRQKNTIGNLENVGYAKVDKLGLYNVFMMSDAHTVFGIGAGATTKLVIKDAEKTRLLRIFSHKYPYEYLRDVQNINDQVKDFFGRR